MNTFSKTIALTTAVLIGSLSVAGSASARDWGGRRFEHRHHHDNSDAWAAGAAGLAMGVIAGAILASPPPPRRVYEVEPTRVYPARPDYRINYQSDLEPWTRDWYRYCEDRYRSFDPRSGTFIGYDGDRHFCVAN